MKVKFSSGSGKKSDVLVLPVLSNGNLAVDENSPYKTLAGDVVSHNIQSDAKFKGKVGQTLTFAAPANSGYKKVILLGMGDHAIGKGALRAGGKSVYSALKATGYEKADIVPPVTAGMKVSAAKGSAILADAANAASYSFDKYITDDRAAEKKPAALHVITDNKDEAAKAYAPLKEITEGEFLAANMANEPGNVIFPESAAKLVQKELGALPGIKIRVLDEKEMKKEKMNAALAVGQGSKNPPCMVVIEYDGTDGKTKDWPLALVGKGVTFDTGGISIKPAGGMEEMKMDMAGAAAVIGAFRALAGKGAKVKVVGIVGFAENMPDGGSYRPGDIIRTRSGKTVNVGNTDAEGRLVLCDALDYIQDKYKPKTVIDLATLTGAIVSALAHTFSGVFTPNDELWAKLDKSGRKSGQPGWRMPLHADFARAIKGKVADLENSAPMRWGGASTAAEFLHSFIKASTKAWSHLDIAGTAIPAGGIANGNAVRWLVRFATDYFEKAGKAKPVPATAPTPTPAA